MNDSQKPSGPISFFAMTTQHDSVFRKDKHIRLGIRGLAAAGFILAGISFCGPSIAVSPSDGRESSLKKAYSKYFVVGTAIPSVWLNQLERQLLVENFGTLTPEMCMNICEAHTSEDRYDFANADALVNMALASGLTVNAQTLLYHYKCPDWFFVDGNQPASRELVLKRTRAHIAAVAGHFSGRVVSWDVVNEVIGGGKDYLRKTKWLECIGEDYIAEAFIAARQADPKAELYFNDYSIESQPRRDKALRLIRDLKKRGASIQGIGIQGHWIIDKVPYEDIEDAILAFHAEGLKVAITELDIDVVGRKKGGAEIAAREGTTYNPYIDGLPDEVQQRLADQYARLFALFLKHHDKISRVSFWGLHDGRTWLNSWPYTRINHPLFWDRTLQPKPALAAVLNLVQQAKQRDQPKTEGEGK
jgi:endo-1,4-beta-xylanase